MKRIGVDTALWFVFCAIGLGFAIGAARMKRWQDTYYHTHPPETITVRVAEALNLPGQETLVTFQAIKGAEAYVIYRVPCKRLAELQAEREALEGKK